MFSLAAMVAKINWGKIEVDLCFESTQLSGESARASGLVA